MHVVETGAVYTRIRVVHPVRSSRITEDIYIYSACNRVDFALEIDWREKGKRDTGVPQLKMSFAAGMRKPVSRSEGPFYLTERVADGQENPTQTFVSLCGEDYGFTVLNDGTYGYDALGSRLRMTLVRNACDPDADSDNGIHRKTFSFFVHDGALHSAALMEAGMAFNRPLVVVKNRKPRRTHKDAFSLSGSDAIVCTALRNGERDGETIIRMYETSGTAQSVILHPGIAYTDAKEITLAGAVQKILRRRKDGSVRCDFRPWEVKTVTLT